MMKDLITFSNLSPVGSLEAYTHWANQIPMLSQEEEISLANSYRDHEDLTAAQKLVLPHLRFVIKIARGYSGYGLAIGDLIQEGNVGLMKAVKRFDPSMGVRLVSFAIHWIKAEIHEFILRNWRIVKIATTKAQRKLFFNLRKMRNRVEHFGQKEMLDVAKELNVNPAVVEEMTMRMDAAYDIGFDGEDDDGDGERNFAPMHYLEDKRYDPAHIMESSDWEEQGQTQLSKALVKLDERSQDILQQRWLVEDKATLQDLALKYNVSAERIRQLEQNAMKKLRAAMEVEMAVQS